MNIFSTDKATFALGLLVTLLGWQATKLIDDITAGQSVVYRVETPEDGSRIAAVVHNVSRVKSLTKARFALACPPEVKCIAANSQTLRVYPPNGVYSTISGNESVINLETSLAAGGRLEFGARLVSGTAAPKFLYVPNPEAPLDIYVFDGASTRGIVVENYATILTVLLFASFALFVVLVVLGIFRPQAAPAGGRV